jgi:hypothetical protein
MVYSPKRILNNNGTRISGSYTDTTSIDGFYETFREELPTVHYNPSNYVLGGSTQLFSGSIANLRTDDSVYMQFQSYPTEFSEATEIFGNNAGNIKSQH